MDPHAFLGSGPASPGGRRRLRRGQLLRVAPGIRIRVAAGILWVTGRGDPVDHLLGPGARWLAGAGTIVQALEEAEIGLDG